ncbi:hypothetical protein ABIB94_007051 [Bradyrhizobium sp. JR7.2]|uniref:hypothetical protein n=1 Tax=Bradyrhizobium sp. JR7.2 TaxID=3156375 RepID=UPI003395CF87
MTDPKQIPTLAQPEKEKIAAIVLSAILGKADGETYGASHARKMNEDRAEKAAERILALAAQPPVAPVETGRQVSCAVGGKPYADSHQCSSAATAGVYGAEALPPGVSIASANKAIEFLEWLSGYIGHGPAVQISSDQMEYIRSKVHPLVHELDGRAPAQPQTVPVIREALELAEEMLSQAPFSTRIWPNGMHPNRGIEKIRAALALTRPESARGEA